MKGWNDPPIESVLAGTSVNHSQTNGTVERGSGDNNPFRGYLLSKSTCHKRSHSSGGTFATVSNESKTRLSPLVAIAPGPNLFPSPSGDGVSTFSPRKAQFNDNFAVSQSNCAVPLVPTLFVPNESRSQQSPRSTDEALPTTSSLFPNVDNRNSLYLCSTQNSGYLRSASTGCLQDSVVLGTQYQATASSSSSAVTGHSTPLLVPNPSIQSSDRGLGTDVRENERSMAAVLAAKLSHVQLQGGGNDVNMLSSPSPTNFSPFLVHSPSNFETPPNLSGAPSFYSPTGTYSPLRQMSGTNKAGTFSSGTKSEDNIAVQNIQPTFSVHETPSKVSLLERIFSEDPCNDSSQIEKLQAKVQLFHTDWNGNKLDYSLYLLTCKLVHCVLMKQTDLAMRCFIKISVEHSKQAVPWSMAFKKLIRYFESNPNTLETNVQPSSN